MKQLDLAVISIQHVPTVRHARISVNSAEDIKKMLRELVQTGRLWPASVEADVECDRTGERKLLARGQLLDQVPLRLNGPATTAAASLLLRFAV